MTITCVFEYLSIKTLLNHVKFLKKTPDKAEKTIFNTHLIQILVSIF